MYEKSVKGAVSEVRCSMSDTLALDNSAPPLAVATAARIPSCAVGGETSVFSAAQSTITVPSTNTVEATSTALFPLLGNFLDGVAPCSVLTQHAATCTTERGPAMPVPSTRHGATAAAETTNNLMVVGNSKEENLLCIRELQWPKAAKQSHIPRDESRIAHRVKRMAATASAPGPRSASQTKNKYVVPERYVGLEPARIELGLPFETTETKQGLGRVRGETPLADKADKEQSRSLHHDLSNDQVIPVPIPPPYKPSSWEDPQDVLMGIRPYRAGVLAAADTVTSERRRENQRGSTQPLVGDRRVGTVAAGAAKDVHGMPPVSDPRPIMKSFLTEHLVTFVSQPPRSPSPTVSRNGSRAFGVISPLSWSADGGDHRAMSTPRSAVYDKSPRETATSQREGSSPCGYRHITTSSQHDRVPHNSFFPVRPRTARPVPGPFRSRAQTVPQA